MKELSNLNPFGCTVEAIYKEDERTDWLYFQQQWQTLYETKPFQNKNFWSSAKKDEYSRGKKDTHSKWPHLHSA